MGKYSKHTGITKNGNERWRCVIEHNGTRYNLGYFDTEEDAIIAREIKKLELGVSNYVMDLDGEIWASSPTLGKGYVVSNKGRVKSLNFRREGREQLILTHPSINGRYLSIITHVSSYLVHRLVMEAFCGASDLQVNHIDNNPRNNCIENLEYVTNRENYSHAIGGAKGCCYTNGRWMAAIRINKKSKTLGYYDTYEEAHQRYITALDEYGITNRYVKV
jgi:hypothetical protein